MHNCIIALYKYVVTSLAEISFVTSSQDFLSRSFFQQWLRNQVVGLGTLTSSGPQNPGGVMAAGGWEHPCPVGAARCIGASELQMKGWALGTEYCSSTWLWLVWLTPAVLWILLPRFRFAMLSFFRRGCHLFPGIKPWLGCLRNIILHRSNLKT